MNWKHLKADTSSWLLVISEVQLTSFSPSPVTEFCGDDRRIWIMKRAVLLKTLASKWHYVLMIPRKNLLSYKWKAEGFYVCQLCKFPLGCEGQVCAISFSHIIIIVIISNKDYEGQAVPQLHLWKLQCVSWGYTNVRNCPCGCRAVLQGQHCTGTCTRDELQPPLLCPTAWGAVPAGDRSDPAVLPPGHLSCYTRWTLQGFADGFRHHAGSLAHTKIIQKLKVCLWVQWLQLGPGACA